MLGHQVKHLVGCHLPQHKTNSTAKAKSDIILTFRSDVVYDSLQKIHVYMGLVQTS